MSSCFLEQNLELNMHSFNIFERMDKRSFLAFAIVLASSTKQQNLLLGICSLQENQMTRYGQVTCKPKLGYRHVQTPPKIYLSRKWRKKIHCQEKRNQTQVDLFIKPEAPFCVCNLILTLIQSCRLLPELYGAISKYWQYCRVDASNTALVCLAPATAVMEKEAFSPFFSFLPLCHRSPGKIRSSLIPIHSW